MRWNASNQGAIRSCDLFCWLQSNRGPVVSMPKLIWNNITPPKVQFFSWLAWKGRIKTSEFLHSIGVLRGEAVTHCHFCREEPESLNHVLLLCPFTWKIWSDIIDWWGFHWVCPGSVVALFDWWIGTKIRKKELQIWKALPLAVLWSIWKLRNDCVFNSAQPNSLQLCELTKIRVAIWLKSHSIGNSCSYSIHDFIFNFNQTRRCL